MRVRTKDVDQDIWRDDPRVPMVTVPLLLDVRPCSYEPEEPPETMVLHTSEFTRERWVAVVKSRGRPPKVRCALWLIFMDDVLIDVEDITDEMQHRVTDQHLARAGAL